MIESMLSLKNVLQLQFFKCWLIDFISEIVRINTQLPSQQANPDTY